MGLFKLKEEKEVMAKEKRDKEFATKLEKERIEKEYQVKLDEVGLTKMMANREVYKEIMIVQNETIINMLAQVILSSQNLTSAGFATAERLRHTTKINEVIRQQHFYNLKKRNILDVSLKKNNSTKKATSLKYGI